QQQQWAQTQPVQQPRTQPRVNEQPQTRTVQSAPAQPARQSQPQYEQLENIQKAWADQGFVVLGFPCNQFMGQEPGSEEQIKTY
ncbi:hypothetical protein ONQ62_28810, partial [Salmonella enterica subsp. enterica serovar Virginia]|nr:hypothetical protein [Salmonella enterica subsp. enterica serovar Virginia]